MTRQWQGSGDMIRVDNPGEINRIPEFDPRSGDHFWIVSVAHRVNPVLWSDPAATPMLDVESLVIIAGPGCFYCEQPYTLLLASRRCKGHP